MTLRLLAKSTEAKPHYVEVYASTGGAVIVMRDEHGNQVQGRLDLTAWTKLCRDSLERCREQYADVPGMTA